MIFGEELLLDCIHAIEILNVSQENSHPHYVTNRAASGFEDGFDVFKREPGFRGNVAQFEFVRAWIYCGLPGHEDKTVGDDGL
jgi:hypothetical protein